MAKGNRSLRYTSEADMPAPMRALYVQQLERIAPPTAPGAPPVAAPAPAPARARPQHKSGEMNKTEKAYAAHLDARVQAGEVLWWKFESIKLYLAPKTFLTVDFFVQLADETLEAHEVKGFWEDDARVKVKVAAAMYPFRFLGVQRVRGKWVFELFPMGGK